MTDTRESVLAREALLGSTTITTSASAIAREVLLSQVTQTWASVMAREILLLGDPLAGVGQTAVSVSVS